MSVSKRVKDILVDRLGVAPDEVAPEANLVDDLGMDSLDRIEIGLAVEEEFGCVVADDEAGKLVTVGDVIEFVEARVPHSAV